MNVHHALPKPLTEESSLLWVPNLLSLVRIPLGILPWFAPRTPSVLWVCLALAALTDWLDGWLARRWSGDAHPTGRGAWLDPLCDKFFVASVALLVFSLAEPPLWIVGLILARELVQLPFVLAYRLVPRLRERVHYDFRSNAVGKATTVAQFLAIMALLRAPTLVGPTALVAGILGVTAVFTYVLRAIGRSLPPPPHSASL